MPQPDPRPPTSHERRSGQPWNASYLDGPAPWDIGGAQPAVVRLAEAGGFCGPVLDVGCGTGDNALFIAARGLPVFGVDVAEAALAVARRTADDRAVDVDFAMADALHLQRLYRRFETILDCGLFHTFDEAERGEYVASLASVADDGAALYVLCFSDIGAEIGPHPVSKDALAAPFGDSPAWRLANIVPEQLRTRFSDSTPAWLATVLRR
ncbi:class I SAM-dependent methyltransferase [Nocardia sp. PE-7]|uniref:class I SAM-dependent methyltransferase n=1 Tax=Nocardia sp. PE-7 TaxID=3058426 RepID=UPI002658453C|nr:class I SAM-dependent methyltransferase [Nocardia sp. PE-7]WKG12585.1 class I SAM-dependent methyltransferase [Nocardia sp. PE-7]